VVVTATTAARVAVTGGGGTDGTGVGGSRAGARALERLLISEALGTRGGPGGVRRRGGLLEV